MPEPTPLRRPHEELDYAQIAELTGLSRNYLRWLKAMGRMPPPDRKYGQSPAWQWSTICVWVESRRR